MIDCGLTAFSRRSSPGSCACSCRSDVRAASRSCRRCSTTIRYRAHRRTGGRVMPRDAAELAHRLAREAEAVCRHYLSNGRREGRYWLVGDVHNTPGRSMFVRLQELDERARRQMDRCRDRGAWRSPRRHPRKPRPARLSGGRRGGKTLSEAPSHRTGSRPKARLSTSTVWITRGRKTTVCDLRPD